VVLTKMPPTEWTWSEPHKDYFCYNYDAAGKPVLNSVVPHGARPNDVLISLT